MKNIYVTYVNGVIWNTSHRKEAARRFEKKVLRKYPKYKDQIETIKY